MSRHLLTFLSGLCLCSLIASCDRSADSDAGQSPVPAAGNLRISAAADLKFALDHAIETFQQMHPDIHVQVSYGSSGHFFAQLANHAPYDLYFSADIAYPRQLIDRGLADADSLFLYAVGRIVVWASRDSLLDVQRLGMAAMVQPGVGKVAIANPQHAPYGRAAEAALIHSGYHDRVKDRLVLGENIAQAAQFVQSGAAEVGIIALSLALAPRMQADGRYWLIPAEYHPSLEQAAVILNRATDRAAAEAFCRFLQQAHGRAILEQYGFVVPSTP